MSKADVITHHMHSPVPFHSLQVLLLLATQWPVRAPVKLLGGGGCSFTPIDSLTGPVGQLFVPRLRGAGVCIQGMHPYSQWNWVLLLAMSHYNKNFGEAVAKGNLLPLPGSSQLLQAMLILNWLQLFLSIYLILTWNGSCWKIPCYNF